MTRKQRDAKGPQLPAAFSAWIHPQATPGGSARAPCHRTLSTVASNVPSAGAIGRPVPVSPAAGGGVWRNSSAPMSVELPRARSSAVPVNVAGRAAPGGCGSTRTLPAQRTGPSESPPGRAIVNPTSMTSEPERAGVPSSWVVIRTRYCSPFGTPLTFQVNDRTEPGMVAIGFHVEPPSRLEANVKFAIAMPVPYAVAVQVIGTDAPVKMPPFGDVTLTSGWSRFNPVADVPTSHRRAESRIAARVELAGFRSVGAVVSIPVISNAKYASRDGVPPHAPWPAVPFGDEETHRSPIGWLWAHDGPPGGLWTLPSVQSVTEVPPAGFGESWSSAPPSRCGVYPTPPVYEPLIGSEVTPMTCPIVNGSQTNDALRTLWSHACVSGVAKGDDG